MPKRHVYIERRPDGKYEVKLARQSNPGIVKGTQKAAIDAAKQRYPESQPDVERVRNTNRGHRDKWRKA